MVRLDPQPLSKEKDQRLAFRFSDPIGEVKKSLDFYIKIVITILVATVITLMVMVTTLIIDSFHINSAAYEEYSAKVDTRNDLIEANQQLTEQNKKLIELNEKNLKAMQDLIQRVGELK